MNAVITVIGKDKIGIVAKVSEECAKYKANVTDVTQSILKDDIFVMIMFINISNLTIRLSDLSEILNKLGTNMNLKINVMHENIFNTMNSI